VKRLVAGRPGFPAELAAFSRAAAPTPAIRAAVAEILDGVARRGDRAIVAYARRFDGARLRPGDFRVPAAEVAGAARRLSKPELRALREAHRAIVAFNRRRPPAAWRARNPQGGWTGEKFDPIRRVGLYIPGGEVPLVSTVLMTATLARIAGCPEIAAFTPVRGGGRIEPALLAALHLAGVREVYQVGGVPAIGAMAYGTAAIPAVDKIFGPGNAYVCEAKRQVFGLVGVDALPGPSELMVIADATARAECAAADLLAQAEHGSGREKIWLVAASARVAAGIEAEIVAQVAARSRAEKIRRVIEDGFVTVLVRDMRQAAAIANFAAPEHLELLVAPATAATLVRAITTAGAIMIGNDTPTVLGDFVAGPSHVLPTARAARFSSGLQLVDFIRRTSLIEYDRASLRRAAPTIAAFAAMERLDAHGRSATIRLE
jgi:histidinol dehydrogenase